MPILNYTTEIDVEKTCGQIQKMLAAAGANAIMTEYDPEGILSSVAFRLDLPGGAYILQAACPHRKYLCDAPA